MLVVFVRHGESVNNLRGFMDPEATYEASRDPDPELTWNGIQGGIRCASYLSRIVTFMNTQKKKHSDKLEASGGRKHSESDILQDAARDTDALDREAIGQALVQDDQGTPLKIRVLCSPFKRAIASADILAAVLPGVTEIAIVPHIHEVGGLFGSDGGKTAVVGPTAAEILKSNRVHTRLRAHLNSSSEITPPAGKATPPADEAKVVKQRREPDGVTEYLASCRDDIPITAEYLPKSGPWWNRGRERVVEAADRAKRFIGELQSGEFGEGVDALVVIGHGLFLDVIWRQLLGVSEDMDVAFVTHNWGISTLTVEGGKWTISCINDASHIPLESRIPHSVKRIHRTPY
ncbi:histidine phosphatase superfamily (branch 1) protein [Gregarina niphandrodes]|uniref:Histidine phosphatase superfamily (Branch 1) protein n=1 Tax=Gregarina niphandrodes TaxID=110365 RepID=A0A023B973_GRENI|nr:histidine phosphatase superfamily (branch 1) protein [Gregarina niphandrodes]EZG71755.1 histidine phosphatase superfamily (branch 1) protein [Gregarina niphandrodes]|eukprot:XP_011129810.1 histidine phosphatase superfamily (branch 1) protein [Gregarina niphandrodes]